MATQDDTGYREAEFRETVRQVRASARAVLEIDVTKGRSLYEEGRDVVG